MPFVLNKLTSPFSKGSAPQRAVPLKSEHFSQSAPRWDNQDTQQCPPISFFRKQDLPQKNCRGRFVPDEVSSQILYLMVFRKRVIFYCSNQGNIFLSLCKQHILWINLCLECHKFNLPVQRGMFIGMEIVIYISCTKLHSKKWLNSKTKGWDSFCWIPRSLRNDEVMSMK